MRIKILLVATTLSLLVVSCGKSDESAQVTNTGNEVPDTQVTTVIEAPATAETIKVAEETVAVSEPVAQAPQQTECCWWRSCVQEGLYKLPHDRCCRCAKAG